MTNIADLPSASFSPSGEGDFRFSVWAAPAEYRLYMDALFPFIAEGVALDVEYSTPAWLSRQFGAFTAYVGDGQSRQREVALALNAVLSKINEAG